jgi:acyl carrier protein
MDVQAIQKQVREYVFENFIIDDSEEFLDDASFLETGLIDSTGILELIGFLEETWDVEVEDDEMIPENLDGIASAARFVASKLSA